MTLRNSSGALIIPLLMAFGAVAHADEWNKQTTITVNQTMEVPGAILPAGSYIFKLVDSQSNRNIVQVLNTRQDHVYATVIAINNYQMEPKGHTVFTFYEVPAGNPQPVRAWFYPGDNYGQEFVYTKHEREQFARVKTETTTMPTATPQPAPEAVAAAAEPSSVVETPAVVEQEQTTVIARNEPPAPPAETPAPTPAPVMPQTASNIPLFALLGLILVSASVGLRVFAKRLS